MTSKNPITHISHSEKNYKCIENKNNSMNRESYKIIKI